MLHLITVATHSERYLPVLEKQAQKNGVKLVKLGMGKKYIGHYMKDLETIEYLKTINRDDIVAFVDGFDSLMLAHKDEVMAKFNETGGQLLLSVENIGIMSFIHATVFERVKGKYINTGLYMGKAGFLLDFLEEMYKTEYNKQSNQKTWCSHLFKLDREGKFDGIKLDNESKVFLNHSFTTSNNPALKGSRVMIDNGEKPCFIQGNGCEDMTHIIGATGNSQDNIHKGEFMKKKIAYNLKAIFKVYTPILTFYVFLVIMLLITFGYLGYNAYKNRNHEYFYV
jgi:hypothetical protein